MDVECEVVTLEDNKDYIIADKIEDNGKTYAYLTNENDIKDFCIRIIEEEGNGYKLTKLLDENEFNKALSLLTSKYNN